MQPTQQQQDALDEAMRPGERWDTLHGNLCDHSSNRDSGGCPDDIAAVVARRYVITTEGRLFRLVGPDSNPRLRAAGPVYEMSPQKVADGNPTYKVTVDGKEWWPTASALVRRAFSPLEGRGAKSGRDRRGIDVVSLDTYHERPGDSSV
mgnify:CR=1 FL=1